MVGQRSIPTHLTTNGYVANTQCPIAPRKSLRCKGKDRDLEECKKWLRNSRKYALPSGKAEHRKSYTYKSIATQYGTSRYHSHYSCSTQMGSYDLRPSTAHRLHPTVRLLILFLSSTGTITSSCYTSILLNGTGKMQIPIHQVLL